MAKALNAITALPAFTDVPRRFKSFPVDHDRFAPLLRCGEFAVIDTSRREPEKGQFILYRSESSRGVHQAIIQLKQPDQTLFEEVEGDIPDRPLWMLIYGRSRVGNWTPDCASWAPGGYMTSADGPIGDRCLRDCIVGRVVGVMRALAVETDDGN